MQPWDMGERPSPPEDQLPPWYERLAPYAAGAAVLIAIYLILALIEQSGVGLAFVLFLGTLVALGAGGVWLFLTVLDWLGVPLILRVRDVATRTVFALGVLALLVLGALGKFAPPERPQILDSQGPLPSVPLDERALMLLVVPLVVALMLGIMSWARPSPPVAVAGARGRGHAGHRDGPGVARHSPVRAAGAGPLAAIVAAATRLVAAASPACFIPGPLSIMVERAGVRSYPARRV